MFTALRHPLAELATSTGHRTVERPSRRDFAFPAFRCDPRDGGEVWLVTYGPRVSRDRLYHIDELTRELR